MDATRSEPDRSNLHANQEAKGDERSAVEMMALHDGRFESWRWEKAASMRSETMSRKVAGDQMR